MTYECCNEKRKAQVLLNASVNGIDYLEVLDSETAANLGSPIQRTLLVHCLNPLTQDSWSAGNVMIIGGESITNIQVDWVEPAVPGSPPGHATGAEQSYFETLPDKEKVLVVRTHVAGDFSTYRLRLVNSASQAALDPFEITEALSGFDPQLADVSFSFKIECGPNFDCAPQMPDCAVAPPTPPPINYLAKDYGSFRTILLDRLNQLLPDWGGSSEADFGVALAELIAYVGDYLSYQQDAVATEAYFETARSRVSLRRHALLVDYHVHDGCNSRAWIQLQIPNSSPALHLCKSQTRFFINTPGAPANLAPGAGNEEAALLAGVIAFEPMQDATLYPEHNQMCFYTWHDGDCCLPEGATEATLQGTFANLRPGDVLIFKEMVGPQTGNPSDADIRHRCAVRLTQVATCDRFGNLLEDTLFSPPVQVTEIQWSADDALPFPVCLSSTFVDETGKSTPLTDVSAVFGNVVLADQGMSLCNKNIGTVAQPLLYQPPDPAADRCNPQPPAPIPVRFRPTVLDSPLTQAVPLPANTGSLSSAYELMNFDPKNALPAITLTGTSNGTATPWIAEQDLLESSESAAVFVVEVESDGTAELRFGDGTNGKRPDSGTVFTADYRIGNGTAGNVGSDSIVNVAAADARIQNAICTNPLPAKGGTDPEANDQIRRRAPQAFQTQERAITMADYQNIIETNPQVDNAVATQRWTGSWYTVFITTEPAGAGNLTPVLAKTLKQYVDRYRLAGQDVELGSPQYVPLEITLSVCVDPAYFQSYVQQSLVQVLGSKIQPNGQKGLFYPDNFTFGQPVYLSPIYAAARKVPGVLSVIATVFQPQGVDTGIYLAAGEIKLGQFQIARMDNDPNFPGHGQLTITMQGGK